MGAFEHFPYTNFQDLNLNWLLSKVKEYGDSIGDFENELNEAVDLFNALKNNVIELGSEINTINDHISDLTQSISIIVDNLENVNTNLGDLNNTTQLLTNRINEISIDVNYLSDKVDNIESTIQVIAEQVVREFIESGQLQLRLSEQYDAINKALTLYISGGSD